MIYYRTTKTIYLEIHEDPGKVLESLTEGWTASGDKFIQMVLKEMTEDNETIVHWTLEDQNKNSSINLLLRLKVERDANGEIRIAVESIEEKGEAGAATLLALRELLLLNYYYYYTNSSLRSSGFVL